LSAENTAKLTETLKKYIDAGRRVRGGSNAPAAAAKKSDPQRLEGVRERAGKNGYEVSSGGRIPSEVVEAHDTAHQAHPPGRGCELLLRAPARWILPNRLTVHYWLTVHY
jgi:hypothetical protein